MKILAVYDSRHGFTDRCLDLLAADLPAGLDRWPLRTRPGVPDWSSYDAVVVGGPVYFSRWSPRLVGFLTRHATDLARVKCLATFVVSLSPRVAALAYHNRGLPPLLAGKPGHVACFGGGIVWKNLTWWEKILVKRSRGIETDASNLDLSEIQGLANWLTQSGSANQPRT